MALGELKTNLSGVRIYLSWLDATPIDLSNVNKRFNANQNSQFDISFWAKPYAQGQTVEKGLIKISLITIYLGSYSMLIISLT